MRGVTLVFTILVTLYAIYSDSSIFKMVENAYQVTLVMAFVPLVAGIYWKCANTQGALTAIFCGLAVWLSILMFGSYDPYVPAHFAGLFASVFGMITGSLLPNFVAGALPQELEHAHLHHLATSHTEQVSKQLHQHTPRHNED